MIVYQRIYPVDLAASFFLSFSDYLCPLDESLNLNHYLVVDPERRSCTAAWQGTFQGARIKSWKVRRKASISGEIWLCPATCWFFPMLHPKFSIVSWLFNSSTSWSSQNSWTHLKNFAFTLPSLLLFTPSIDSMQAEHLTSRSVLIESLVVFYKRAVWWTTLKVLPSRSSWRRNSWANEDRQRDHQHLLESPKSCKLIEIFSPAAYLSEWT